MIESAATRPLAAKAEDHGFLAPRVAEAGADLVHGIERAAGRPAELMLLGSLARGEGTVWRGAAGPVGLSDLDFAVVLPDEESHAKAARVAPTIARALAHRAAERGLVGGVDVGVYTRARLARQERRPGTLEARRSALVLVGDPRLPASYPAFEEREVPLDEALVLLENRGAELLLAWPGAGRGVDPRRALQAMYAGLKAQLDGAFAFVVSCGECPATTQARQAALERRTVEGRSEPIHAVLPDFEARVAFWGAMKLAPDPAAIALHLGLSDPTDLDDLARHAWREGARAWVAWYRVVAARALRLAGAGAEPPPLVALAAHAAHRARPTRRVRRWIETARAFTDLERDGRARWPLRSGAARLSLALRGAPEHELAACVAWLLGGWTEAGSVDWRPLVARAFPGAPPAGLDWEHCRAAAVRLWDSMQLGGTRTAWEGA